jgi:hypothetical protein
MVESVYQITIRKKLCFARMVPFCRIWGKNEKLLVVILKKHVERRNKAAHRALPKKGKSDVHP